MLLGVTDRLINAATERHRGVIPIVPFQRPETGGVSGVEGRDADIGIGGPSYRQQRIMRHELAGLDISQHGEALQ